MMSLNVSRAYQIVLQFAEKCPRYTEQEVGDLENEAKEANSDLETDIRGFVDALSRTEKALESKDDDSVVAAIIDLRIALMRLGNCLGNLTDAISGLFEKQAIRRHDLGPEE
ncbi:hypothetical protein DBR33_01175 [Stenotrophomonas sp. HMWF022]|uniref:hypothetical protein n=1 Tax=Stenotrophomonas sp. HMWF023 TaxID=2056859 RepID=UPI000D35B6B2|nr:hypothetical protein [Stenotrophomonas sp. HMWF023]PTS74835.1 hypothetical protein DBR20_12765 [Stenotrophomonas sp. HMWF023]PTT57983.1 hypothetical protein DBR33_01175 [Stenotrophomonas sp. HMWF022]